MAEINPILYSVLLGLMLLAEYFVRLGVLELLIHKAKPLLLPWIVEVWGGQKDKERIVQSVLLATEAPDLLSSCSTDWWEDDGLFQLEKRAIFSQVRATSC